MPKPKPPITKRQQQWLDHINAADASDGSLVEYAAANKLQRTMNITLGSTLSTIGLTIPAVLAIGMFTGKRVELGLEEPEIYLLLLTLLVSIVQSEQ